MTISYLAINQSNPSSDMWPEGVDMELATKVLSQFTLCFLSLNNPEESAQAKKFFADKALKVVELQPRAEYPIVALQKAIKTAHCDGLVLSGHHRKQGFEGKLVPGYLPTHEVLTLSCMESNKEWFRSVKHLWLQGCATGISQKQNIPIFADTFRSIFPNASVYTWSGSAPSRVAPKTIPFHFENFRRIQSISKTDIGLNGWPGTIKNFFSQKNTQSRNAWTKLRYSSQHRWKGIYNRGAQSFTPFSQNKLNRRARVAVCKLAAARSAEKVRSAFNLFLSSPSLIKRFLPLLLEHTRNSRYRGDIFARANSPLGVSKIAIRNLKNIYLGNREKSLTRLRALNLAEFLKLPRFHRGSISKTAARKALLEISRLSYRWDSVEQKHYRWETYRELFLSNKDHGIRLFTPVDLSHISGADSLIALMRTLIEVNPNNLPGFLVMVSKHKDFSPSVRRYIMPLLALVSPLERSAIKQKIKEIYIVRPKNRHPASE